MKFEFLIYKNLLTFHCNLNDSQNEFIGELEGENVRFFGDVRF